MALTAKKPIAVIGIGNTLMADEGIGPHAIKYLEQFDWSDDVEFIDAAVAGPSLIHMIEERKVSIIIDCANWGGAAGDVIMVRPDQIKRKEDDLFSLHGTTLMETLLLAESTGIKISSVFIICVQPKKIDMSMDLSDEVAGSLPRIRQELNKILGSAILDITLNRE